MRQHISDSPFSAEAHRHLCGYLETKTAIYCFNNPHTAGLNLHKMVDCTDKTFTVFVCLLLLLFLQTVNMAEDIKAKLENYRTAPFDARFPNQNQTRNCWSNYVGKT